MATDKQTAANRLNSQKCTGPRTPAGRATSSQNALKTGIDAKSEVIRCEIRSEYDELIAEYYTRYTPAVPEERGLVDTLIRSEWLGRRYVCAEAAIWEYGFENSELRNLGLVYLRSQETFARVARRINSAHRNFQSALKQLRQIQADRLSSEPSLASIPSEPPEASIPSESPEAHIPSEQSEASTPSEQSLASIPSELSEASIPNRDCQGAAPQTPEPLENSIATQENSIATEPLNPKLVSFLIFPDPTPAPPTDAPASSPDPVRNAA